MSGERFNAVVVPKSLPLSPLRNKLRSYEIPICQPGNLLPGIANFILVFREDFFYIVQLPVELNLFSAVNRERGSEEARKPRREAPGLRAKAS